ncbi:MAG: ferrous-iron efflux pump FieF [Candidatus Paceibacteria bacterium]|jgi:ferrous-iron efflux pump FieF
MSRTHPESTGSSVSRLVRGALVVNVLLLVAAAAVFYHSGSQLVLAQGADSLLDVGSGIILAFSVWLSLQPSDESHHYGHERAEPIGALVTAILAGVLSFEVLRSAVESLLVEGVAHLDSPVALILGGKLAVKALFMVLIARQRRDSRSSALSALWVDTRNDLVACSVSLVGYGLVRSGYPTADGLVAIPVAIYIGKGGFDLARENLRFLMGEAPSTEVLDELRDLGRAVPGVIGLGELRAQFAGPTLHVEVEVEVLANRSAVEAHDISVSVQNTLEGHTMVGKVYVHVDTVNASA